MARKAFDKIMSGLNNALAYAEGDATRRTAHQLEIHEAEAPDEARPWRDVFNELRPDDAIPSAILRGSRVKEGLTQVQLSAATGIPRRHISEMEHGKRPIGRESARKLAQALNCDYRVFL